MTTLHRTAFAIGLTAALAANTASAGDLNVPAAPPCTLGGYGFEIYHFTYWQAPPPAFPHVDSRCDLFFNGCRLNGWIVAPPNGSNRKAIVMAHGSQGMSNFDHQSLNEYCEVTKRLVQDGFVVFWPFRRGVYDTTTPAMIGKTLANPGSDYTPGGRFGAGASPGDPDYDRGGYFDNTGTNAVDWSNAMAGSDHSVDAHAKYYLDYLQDEAELDTNDAINALVARQRGGAALVDPDRIELAGHSIGGAFATLASAVPYDHEPQAFASLSGGAMSYASSAWWPARMTLAAAGHQRPIYFHRALLEDPSVPPTFDSSTQPYNWAVGYNGGAVLYNYPKPDVQQALCTGQLADPSLHYWCVHAQFVQNPYFIDGFWWGRFIAFLDSHV